MRRRALLRAVAVGGVALAGCLGSDEGFESPEPDRTTSRVPTTTYPRSDPGTAVRCRGDPVSVERSMTDRPGYDDDIRYFAGNETVKFVAGRSGDEPAWFETMSFSEWGAIKCAEAGLERAREVTAERLNTRRFGSGMGQPPDEFTAESPVVTLSVATHVGPEGERITPPFSLRWLADRAPRSVDATVSLDGDSVSRTVPVYASHETIGSG